VGLFKNLLLNPPGSWNIKLLCRSKLSNKHAKIYNKNIKENMAEAKIMIYRFFVQECKSLQFYCRLLHQK